MRAKIDSMVELGVSEKDAKKAMGVLNAARGEAEGIREKAAREATKILGGAARVYTKGEGYRMEATTDEEEIELAAEEEDGPDIDDSEVDEDEDEEGDEEESDDEDEEDDPRDVALAARIIKRWGVSEKKAWSVMERAADKLEDKGQEPSDANVLKLIGTWLDAWSKENGKGEFGKAGGSGKGEQKRGLTPRGKETAALVAKKYGVTQEEGERLVGKAIGAIEKDTSESEEGGIPGRTSILAKVAEWKGGGGQRPSKSRRGRRAA
jgi:hypothetical protein